MSSKSYTRPLKGKSLIDFPNSFVVIDIETTGLFPSFDHIIELAALKVENGIVTGSFQELINPGFDIDPFIEELTGITNEMLLEADYIEEVLPSYMKFIGEDSIIVGHNVNFDINFIYDNSLNYLDSPLSNDFIDTMRISRRLIPEIEHHRLCDLIEYFDITITTQHRALADCYSTFEVLKQLEYLAKKKFGSIEDFINSTKKQNRYFHHPIDLRTITASVEEFDESHPLFNKHCCFTGALEKYTRVQAAQIVVNYGGICDNTVTKKTNFLILGNNDYCSLIKDGKSSKHKKAEELILKGCDLTILPESVFYEMIELEDC